MESLEQSKKVTELEAKAKIEKQKKQGLWLLIILGGLLALSLLYAQGQRARKKQAVQDGLLIKANIERDKLEQQLEFKQKELASQILNLTQKNTLLQNLKLQIESLKNEKNGQSVSKLIKTIQQNVENSDEWDQFLQTFKSIHSSFLMKLHAMSENLTSGEIRIASLMKMNLSSKEIATMLNITDDGVKKARYRLRKKLGLESDINIQDYLLSLD